MKKEIILIFEIFLILIVIGCTQPSTDQNSTEIESSFYTSDLYTLEKPTRWEVEENGDFTHFKSPAKSDTKDLVSDKFQENVVVYVQPLEQSNQSLINFFQDSISVLMTTTPKFTVLDHHEDNFGDVPAYRIIYTEGEEDSKIKYLQVFAVKDGNGYILTYTTPADTFDTYLPEAEAIIRSYKIT